MSYSANWHRLVKICFLFFVEEFIEPAFFGVPLGRFCLCITPKPAQDISFIGVLVGRATVTRSRKLIPLS